MFADKKFGRYGVYSFSLVIFAATLTQLAAATDAPAALFRRPYARHI